MKILITGSNGQLGNELQDIIKKGYSEIGSIPRAFIDSEILALDEQELDITKKSAVEKTFNDFKPDIVINCAAFTNVDLCETKKTLAFNVNTLGPRNLAIAAEEIGAKIVQVSTDYVFSGTGDIPLTEYEDVAPYSVYGKTKLMGEDYVKDFSTKYFIVRTSWLYGSKGKNFVYTMLNLGEIKEQINVVNDQVGNPTNANDLAHHILKLVETTEYGIYHCTGEGECTWYDFACEIMKLGNKNCIVNPCISQEFPMVAKRPEYSSLDNMMLRNTIGNDMRDWKIALKSFIEQVNN